MRKLSTLLVLLLFLGIHTVNAQKFLSGTVSDKADGSGIPGATVMVKGDPTVGITTNLDGYYELTVPDDAQLLVFSFVGMISQEIEIGNKTLINVALETEMVDIEGVVVTALGISRDKKALGYSVQDVSGEEMAQTRSSNALSTLSGKVAGVQISGGSGNMGGSTRVLIRGVNSITGNNEPLFVIDGIPLDNSNFNDRNTARGAGGIDYGNMAQDINPDDIENISVLKGPQAAALYGNRAANGVIMITTKKGSRKTKGKTIGVSVNTGMTFEQVALLPNYQTKYGGGYGDFSTATINGNEYNVVDYAIDESWGPKYDGQQVLHWDAFDNNDKYGSDYLKTRPWITPKNDVKDFFKTGTGYNTNVALHGGTDLANFRLSYTNFQSSGYMPNSELDRNTLNFNGEAKLSDWISANAGITYIKTEALGRPVTGYDDNNIMQKFNQWGQRQLDMERLRQFQNPDGSQRSWNRIAWDNPTPAYSDNPYWTRYINYQNDERDRYYGHFGVTIKMADWIKFRGSVYADHYSFRNQERVAIGSQATSEYVEGVRTFNEYNYEGLFLFDKKLSSDFHMNGTLGVNIRHEKRNNNNSETSGGLGLPNFYSLQNSLEPVKTTDFEESRKIHSVLGSVSLGWRSMLYLDGTFRNDWSSTLPKDNWAIFYPSVTSSWVFSELPSLSDVDWLSLGKIRAGWAQVGNSTDPYDLIEAYASSDNLGPWVPFGGIPIYSVPNTMTNKELKPELTTSWELGLEMAFFLNRLSFDFTYYDMKTEDLLTYVAVSGSSGYLYKALNAGTMENRGIELALTGIPVQTRDFSWELGVNLTKNQNELTEIAEGIDNYRLANGPFKVTTNAFVGEAYGALMGTNYVIDANGNKVVGTNGRYLKTSDVEVLGTVQPDYNLGLSTRFNYKGFTLSALVDIQKGGSYFSTTYMWGMYSGMLSETTAENENGINIREDIENGGGITLNGVYGYVNEDGAIVYTDEEGNLSETPVENTTAISAVRYAADHYARSDAQSIFDADYIKLRELRLGYKVPSKYTGPLKNVNVAVWGRNLFIWGLDNQHIDPETAVTTSGNVQGIEGGALPSLRTFGFNVSFNI